MTAFNVKRNLLLVGLFTTKKGMSNIKVPNYSYYFVVINIM